MQQSAEQVVEIAANLDDATGESIGQAIAALLNEGALDVWSTPIGMKQSRPGVTLALLCLPDDRDRLARRLIELTGSFGVRFRDWQRLVLDRRHVSVDTIYGPVRLKVGSLGGRDIVAKPEFADALARAEQHGVPVRGVIDAARAAAGAIADYAPSGDDAP